MKHRHIGLEFDKDDMDLLYKSPRRCDIKTVMREVMEDACLQMIQSITDEDIKDMCSRNTRVSIELFQVPT